MSNEIVESNVWMILPFGLLLAAIALAPLFFPGWWSRHYPKVSLGLGAVTVVYYLAGLNAWPRAAETAMEYVSFIALIGSLYVVAGGIHIQINGEATPWENVKFLLFGAVMANFLGTTGASMLLIRPWLRMNKYRVTGHHVVFFIFIVSNVGGCLTPIGDPPLFLGYLQGIPFWWVAVHCWPIWAVGVGTLLAMFYAVDRHNYMKAPKPVRAKLAEPVNRWSCAGLSNVLFLGVILAAVFIQKPVMLRELLMVGAAAGSYYTTRKAVHHANEFNFHPIMEVVILFAGIFATMMPALDFLEGHAGELFKPTAALFFWASGSLSSVLDNAPTYLSFLSAIFGAFIKPEVIAGVQTALASGASSLTGSEAEHIRATLAALHQYHSGEIASGAVTASHIETAFLLGNAAYNQFILAISVGAVFFGANTYIGNGPNFMVKAIAEQSRVPNVPTFLGYIFKYTLPFMIPMLVLVWFLFFRG
jgi:Na+/H+ antiporter NhaD/arsenite permease-like protein